VADEFRFKRLLIMGASGSGTTTLGVALAARLGYPVFDADKYFWLPTDPPFQTMRPRAERLAQITTELARVPQSIVSGTVQDWGAELEASFDLVVFLRIPPDVRMARLERREVERYGKLGNPEFLEWARKYDTAGMEVRSLVKQEVWLAARRCPVLRLENNESVEDRVLAVLEFGQ